MRDTDALPANRARTLPAEDLARASHGAGVRLVVVDDHQPFRGAMCDVVAATSRFRVVGEAASGEDALVVVDAIRPDLVPMDVRTPGIGGREATKRLVERHPHVVVWLVTADATSALGDLADACGAAAVDKRDVTPRRLRELWEQCRRTNGAAVAPGIGSAAAVRSWTLLHPARPRRLLGSASCGQSRAGRPPYAASP